MLPEITDSTMVVSKNFCGDLEFSQPSEVIKVLPCHLHWGYDVCVPCQVLRDVNSKVLGAAHFLHQGSVDREWCAVDALLLPPSLQPSLRSWRY